MQHIQSPLVALASFPRDDEPTDEDLMLEASRAIAEGYERAVAILNRSPQHEALGRFRDRLALAQGAAGIPHVRLAQAAGH